MRFQLSPRLALLIVALGLLLVPCSRAIAEDQDTEREGTDQATTWSMDVRIVQVRSDAKAGLAPASDGGPTTTGFDFARMLEVLRGRGTLTVLMDQRVTTVHGRDATVSTEQSIPIRRFDTADNTQERIKFDSLRMGCEVRLRPWDDQFGYDVMVRWASWQSLEDTVPTGRTSWKGEHRPLRSGETLTLHSREHILGKEGQPEVAEIYCFLTVTAAR